MTTGEACTGCIEIREAHAVKRHLGGEFEFVVIVEVREFAGGEGGFEFEHDGRTDGSAVGKDIGLSDVRGSQAAAERDGPAVGLFDSCENLDEGAFAGAVGADECKALALLDVDRDAGEEGAIGEVLCDRACGEEGGHSGEGRGGECKRRELRRAFCTRCGGGIGISGGARRRGRSGCLRRGSGGLGRLELVCAPAGIEGHLFEELVLFDGGA